MCALFVTTDIDKLVLNHLKDPNPLTNRAVVNQFLKEVVAVLILHDLSHVSTDLVEKKLNHLWS